MNSKTSTVVEYAVSAKLKLLRKLIMQEKNLTIYQTLKDTLQNWAKKLPFAKIQIWATEK